MNVARRVGELKLGGLVIAEFVQEKRPANHLIDGLLVFLRQSVQ
jgi:hypothetical protein